MGLLDQVFGGSGKQGSGMSPLTLALLAVLAYRTYQGKGRLADMLGRGEADKDDDARRDPQGGAVTGRPDGGSLGDLLGGGAGGGLGDLLKGGLGGLLAGGAAGGALSGGLADIIKQFQQAGQGDVADTWVRTGPNKQVSPRQVEDALGQDTVNSLAEQAGMPREDVLSKLSEGLPEVVDQLTPEGRLPTEQEASRWV